MRPLVPIRADYPPALTSHHILHTNIFITSHPTPPRPSIRGLIPAAETCRVYNPYVPPGYDANPSNLPVRHSLAPASEHRVLPHIPHETLPRIPRNSPRRKKETALKRFAPSLTK
ncbi:hypothetical protein BS50DRAFT_1514 [Corynespora cassiicola Philippines]|uniref:Uncharacterized protein n=1 Tax=Corynespora cassiicola Philippines TaxID=1448308 RepID=A0A2T2P854_CORCC|nr:hypothetical protein BS50DRAFT_1514 [Corynespora cassiicola Philippines]